MSDALITSLTAALEARPDDATLRVHLGGLLVDAGRAPEAIMHAGLVLAGDPGNAAAQALMRRALTAPGDAASGAVDDRADQPDGAGAHADLKAPAAEATRPPAVTGPPSTTDPLAAYEQELSQVVPPRYADPEAPPRQEPARHEPPRQEPPGRERVGGPREPVRGEGDRQFDVEHSTVRLADVGGMNAVKERLELAFLGPLRNPELRRLYGKSLRGGLMLYGPPGCGKTYLARAVAGEMGARFMSLSIVDVLDMWLGNSERNLHELFQTARRNAPCVVFLDEVDALGQKRSQTHSSSMRTVGNQLLAELDGMEGDNDGVFVLAATNTPWQVDPALRRPGRLDRMVLVLPPDAEARTAIVQLSLQNRPIEGINLPKIVAATEDFSGADLTHLCETAAEYAMADSLRSGTVRMIGQRDFDRALTEVRPSTGPWFATARNVAMFANDGGVYDDLVAYLKRRKLLR